MTTSHRWSFSRRVVATVIGATLAAGGCAAGDSAPPPPEAPPATELRSVAFRIVGEAGAPLPDATVTIGARGFAADDDGTVSLLIDRPELAMVGAPDHLVEPFVVDPDLTEGTTIRLLGRLADDGTPRVVLHFGGDTMMGRRYLAPTRPGTAVVDPTDPETARAVVAAVAPLAGAADVTSVNLESVVGTLPDSAAYPGKRFLLQSPPTITDALDELGVDVVTLGNNHLYDWQEAGVASTLRYLDEAGVAAVGAGRSEVQARLVTHLDAFGTRVGYLSYTSVTGDVVNDALPGGDVAEPASVDVDDSWRWERRTFGFGAAGTPHALPVGEYRIGDVWRWFAAAEDDLAAPSVAAAWQAASETFPELQDWVARRGHGGAAQFSARAVSEDVAALRAAGTDVVVVQIHGGYQFADVASEIFMENARTAIDAGADLVVGHHPHVLQGAEWYRDRLIVSSLGNLLFDQDFAATFPSAILRTVFEGSQLVEARLYPVLLDGYRPVPVGGDAAHRILRAVAFASTADRHSRRADTGEVVVTARAGSATEAAGIAIEHGTGRITAATSPAVIEVDVDVDGVTDLPRPTVVAADQDALAAVGVDLLGIGGFEDDTADGDADGGTLWALEPPRDHVHVVGTASGAAVELTSRSTHSAATVVRPVARTATPRTRLSDGNGAPAGARPQYSVRVTARRSAGAEPFIRIDAYHFTDTDPTADPSSTLIRQMTLSVDLPADDAWHRVEVEVPPAVFADGDGLAVNTVMVYLGLDPPQRGETEVAFDDVAFIEWTAPSTMPPGSWLRADALRTVTRDGRLPVTTLGP